MKSVVFVIPGRLEARTGGSIYNRRMAEGLHQLGWSVDIRELDESFPYPTSTAMSHAAQVFTDIPGGKIVLVDGLALGSMPTIIEHESSRLRIVAIVHLPLCDNVGINRNIAARLEASERRALNAVALVVVTGTVTLLTLTNYGISRNKVAVVEPGTEPAPLAHSSDETRLKLLSVATLNPGKGHEILLQALAAVPSRSWHLTCAGSVTQHPATVERVLATMYRAKLEDQVSLVGELNEAELFDHYNSSDLFVLATLKETYGMAVAEALAHGLPVVSTKTGAIPKLVGNDAGVIVPPGNTTAFSKALTSVLGDPDLRARLTVGARRARQRLPSWEQAFKELNVALRCFDTNE